jgi:hypothetical protein
LGPVAMSQRTAFSVVPGETFHLILGGKGRPVIGRLVVVGFEEEIDWHAQLHTLAQVGPAAPETHPFGEGQYVLDVAPDGSFRVEDVPGGHYRLRVRLESVEEAGGNGSGTGPRRHLQILTQEIRVPDSPGGRSDEPYDVGLVELKAARLEAAIRSDARVHE